MRYRYFFEERKGRFTGFIGKLSILVLVLFIFYVLFLYFTGRPELSEESLRALSYMPVEKNYQLYLTKPVKEIKLYAEQEGQKKEIYHGKLPRALREVSFTLKPKEAGLKDGEIRLTLELSSGFLRKKTYTFTAFVDTLPPHIELVAYTSSPSIGGTLALKVKTEKGSQVSLLQGEHRYTLYPMGQGYYFGLIPVRLDTGERESLEVEAKDRAGNRSSRSFSIRIKRAPFREDRINIDENFINRVIYPLLGDEGKGLSPLEAFKRVNELWRKRDVSSLKELGQRTEPRVLWEGAFIQLPKSKVFAGYGELRHYFYEGQKVSESRHMGFDFASVERAPVPAGNSGIVVFTGWLGIYGKTVIINHGMGLMSLYAHLSEISVKEGQSVRKGEIIGRTGATGFALGDHLHFGLLLQGYEVNPVEWLDPRWVKNHINTVLEAR